MGISRSRRLQHVSAVGAMTLRALLHSFFAGLLCLLGPPAPARVTVIVVPSMTAFLGSDTPKDIVDSLMPSLRLQLDSTTVRLVVARDTIVARQLCATRARKYPSESCDIAQLRQLVIDTDSSRFQ